MSTRQLRWHHCRRRHLSGRTFAACAFIDTPLRGSGQWAVITRCSTVTVSLFASKAAAVAHLGHIDGVETEGCGRDCWLQHELAFIDLLHASNDVAASSPLESA